jgi:hypothetical protein
MRENLIADCEAGKKKKSTTLRFCWLSSSSQLRGDFLSRLDFREAASQTLSFSRSLLNANDKDPVSVEDAFRDTLETESKL